MARIFIAIRFNDEFKRKLVEIQDSLKSRGVEGGRPTGQLAPNRAQSSSLELPRCEGERPTGQLIYSEI